METVLYLLQGLLLLWFFGCIVTYRIGRVVLVEGMGVKSAEMVMLLLYSLSLLLYYLFPGVGQWAVALVLLFWLVVQFFCHWAYTLFGATQKKIDGYNQCFAKTLHLFPLSQTRIVPDLYHIVLHLLILANLLLMIAEIILRF